MKFLRRFIVASALALIVHSAGAAVLTVTYTAADLPDSVPGADRWQFTYHAAGSLNPFEGFDVLFDPSDFAVLSVDATPPGWLTYTLEPDLLFVADGVFSATIDGFGMLPADFVVSFDWLAAGTPGSQLYEVFDDSFNVIAEQTTVPDSVNPIPEPGSLMLIGSGLAAVAMIRRRYQRK
ncbi:MAG: PEP-CTERM sorting domain-containing protein [Nitrosospira sp.]|nr:PEP-CTERM sorting domain-containing protein [Nitrosospira sp.]